MAPSEKAQASLCNLRALNYNFAELPLSALNYNFAEKQKQLTSTASSSPYVRGYIVWRKTILRPMTVMLSIGCFIELILLITTYNVSVATFAEQYVGSTKWRSTFCPGGSCVVGNEGLEGVYYALMMADVLLFFASVASCVMLSRACWHWAVYGPSSRHLRSAYSMIFFAPFVLLLLLPPANFVDIAAVQASLCKARLTSLVPDALLEARAGLAAPGHTNISEAVCSESIDGWSEALGEVLRARALLVNVSTDTCGRALARRASYVHAGECEDSDDDDVRVSTASFASGSLADCATVRDRYFCTPTHVQSELVAHCPVTCGMCEPPPECIDDDAALADIELQTLTAASITTCGQERAKTRAVHRRESDTPLARGALKV